MPRLRMFAGPNGSGKSTIKSVVPPGLLGVYLNPDEIQQAIEQHGFLDVSHYGVKTAKEEILPFFQRSALLRKAGLHEAAMALRFDDSRLDFRALRVNAYFASVAADFLAKNCWICGSPFPSRPSCPPLTKLLC
ncbi:hypothetical protein [Prosthecobacter sp.]|uniref:hypothetical protein n=1 Tax=Prosthecobacter sp. TaxID=1965333 RepID=UPI003784F6B6